MPAQPTGGVPFDRARLTRRGFMADTMREFISEVGHAYGGTIPKAVSIQKIVADRGRRWTPARIEKQLKPILKAVPI